MTKSAWASAWSSSALAGLAAALLLTTASTAAARVFLSRAEALEVAFAGAERVEPLRFVLDDAQAKRVEALAKAPLESRIVTLHAGWRGDALLGYALIDVHTVRTLPEALMIVLDPQGQVRSVRVLAFHEPSDYLPTEGWFSQFEGRGLDPDLQLQGRIHAIAGATLSSRAVTRSVRRALALYQVLVAPAQGSRD